MIAIRYLGDGDFKALRPTLADKEYTIGQVYQMEEWLDRSDISHRHEFAWLREAWRNLPEDLADLYPSETHLRKRALIAAGYYHETATDAGSHSAALRFAATLRSVDEFALVIVRGPIVLFRRAMSQSRRSMDKKTFQESKDKIMGIIADMIGVSPDQLKQEAARAA